MGLSSITLLFLKHDHKAYHLGNRFFSAFLGKDARAIDSMKAFRLSDLKKLNIYLGKHKRNDSHLD